MDKTELLKLEEDKLWAMYVSKKSIEIRDILIEKYVPLVKQIVGKIAMNVPNSVDKDDLISYGTFGLFDAIEKFSPEKEVKFKTYAVRRIEGAIIDELRANDWIPRSVRQKAKEIESMVSYLEGNLGRACTDKEVADGLGITEDEYQKSLLKVSCTNVLSLNDLRFSGDDSEQMTLDDTLKAPENLHPDIQCEKSEIKRIIMEAINELPDNAKQVMVLYYYEELTLREIGEILKVTESRVSQLHTKAIIKLRARLSNIQKGFI